MSKVTISKEEYKSLLFEAKAYRKLASSFASHIIEKPVSEIMENFRSTGKYSKGFLSDLENGLIDLRKSKVWRSR